MSKLFQNYPAEKDPDKARLAYLEEELTYYKGRVNDLENRLEEAQCHSDRLLDDVAELKEYVNSLETALMEATLMSVEETPCDKAKSSST